MSKSFEATKECIRNMHHLSEEQFRGAHTQTIAGLSRKFLGEYLQDKVLLKMCGEKPLIIIRDYVRRLINNIDASPTLIVLTQIIFEQYLKDFSSVCADMVRNNKEEANAELDKTPSQEEAGASQSKH